MSDHITISRKDADLITNIIASGIMADALSEKFKSAEPTKAIDGETSQLGKPMPGPDIREVLALATEPQTTFRFGKKSLAELKGVNSDLVRCASLAISVYTRIDFTVYDGIRDAAEQAHYVKIGTSKTMKSKHLDGLALDLVPIIGGVPKWDWTGCYEIAMAMDKAATQLGIADRITWGGCWDKTLAEYGGDASAYIQAVEGYKARHPGPDFIDGPHFEIRP